MGLGFRVKINLEVNSVGALVIRIGSWGFRV